jgi:hypothetical protein
LNGAIPAPLAHYSVLLLFFFSSSLLLFFFVSSSFLLLFFTSPFLLLLLSFSFLLLQFFIEWRDTRSFGSLQRKLWLR